MQKRVLIADPNLLCCQGLSSHISSIISVSGQQEWSIVTTAHDGASALEAICHLKPDLALISLSLPGIDGLQISRLCRSYDINSHIIMLLDKHQLIYRDQIIKNGVSDVFSKEHSFEKLEQCMNNTLKSPPTSPFFTPSKNGSDKSSSLTKREREVLIGISEGQSSKEIANSLNISHRTVETYRLRIMKKSGCRSVAALTRYAIDFGHTTQ